MGAPQRPYPRAFCTLPRFRSHTETKMATARTQRSISATSRKNRGLRTVYKHYTEEIKVLRTNAYL